MPAHETLLGLECCESTKRIKVKANFPYAKKLLEPKAFNHSNAILPL